MWPLADSQILSGWGRTPRSRALVEKPREPGDIRLRDHPRGNLARGLGRSYGDAAINAGGIVWDTTELGGIEVDATLGVARVGAGVTFHDLLSAGVPAGFFPPVTPGTKYVTMGGAIAADVHGKNHHHDGSIGDHITSITLLTASDDVLVLTPTDDLFAATVGGMGLTGIVLESTLRLLPVESPVILVDTLRTEDLAETLEVMTVRDQSHRYSVAWVDLTHPRAPGRGVVTLGDHASGGGLANWKAHGPLASVPARWPVRVVNTLSVRAFNEFWFRKAPSQRSKEPQAIDSFFYPLDVAGNWNRLYGRDGFIQYQMVIPFGAEDVLKTIVHDINVASVPAPFSVLKRMGGGRGLLSFPIPGWTLAVDLPASDRDLEETLRRVDHHVADCGGRVYLAKDSRLDSTLLPVMYPELDRWRDIADKADPTRAFRSDLDRRLELRGTK